MQVNLAGPRYFETEGMTLLLGREFGAEDTEGALHVAIVNEALVRRFYFGRNPIGKTFHFQHFFNGGEIEVVGVVKNAKYNNPRDDATQMVFLPVFQASSEIAQLGAYGGDLEVRTAGNPASVTGQVRRAIAEIDKNLPVDKVTTLKELVDRSLNEVSLIAGLASLFGVLAMLLACVGLYGVMSYAVARRTNEIGIRMALGAGRSDVLRLVVGRGFKLTVVGVVIGIGAAVPLARFLASLPIGVKPADPLTYFVVSLILTSVALIASYIPGAPGNEGRSHRGASLRVRSDPPRRDERRGSADPVFGSAAGRGSAADARAASAATRARSPSWINSINCKVLRN